MDLHLNEIVQEMEAQSIIIYFQLHKITKERNELLHSAFIAHIGTQYQREQPIFLDESSIDERGYGYSDINTRAIKKVVFVRGKRYTFLPALALFSWHYCYRYY